jgi:hypothetical protein
MIEILASESANGFGMSQWLELGVILTTVLLTVATVGLWVATAQVHKDEVIKMTSELSHANDNMTDVALAEIDAHHLNRERMRHVRRQRHTTGAGR